MKFFLADSQDLVDPSFDFLTERRDKERVRQRDDLYAHELFRSPPLDGLLISKAIVDGCNGKPGKYTIPQRQRLRRLGARAFFRLDARDRTRHIKTMGDCGAFSYVSEVAPPFTVPEVIGFYEDCQLDFGISVDHVILAYDPQCDTKGREASQEIRHRQELTLDLARRFWQEIKQSSVVPIGVAQGWSPVSYARAVSALQRMGYRYIAVGGLVPLKTTDILECLTAIDVVRRSNTRLHLLGVTRCDRTERFAKHGVTSFDSTSPLLQAFKDGEANYHTRDGAYIALRVPQADGNTAFRKRISSGSVDQQHARELEAECLRLLRAFDGGNASVDECLDVLERYEVLVGGKCDRIDAYRQALEAAPWRDCTCDVCRSIGIEVMIFRGSERNKRRGFHNIHVLYNRLRSARSKTA